jgi:AP-4 complex subunit sigma-1
MSHPTLYYFEFQLPIFRNKQGQTRLSQYYEWISLVERSALESEIIRKCLSRSELQCSFVEYRGYKVVYRRYASLFFIVGTKMSKDAEDNPENELGLLEFIHTLVETMDKWAGSICELDIMYQLEQVHFLLDEMVQNGFIVETNKMNVLRPLDLMERESQKAESIYR